MKKLKWTYDDGDDNAVWESDDNVHVICLWHDKNGHYYAVSYEPTNHDIFADGFVYIDAKGRQTKRQVKFYDLASAKVAAQLHKDQLKD